MRYTAEERGKHADRSTDLTVSVCLCVCVCVCVFVCVCMLASLRVAVEQNRVSGCPLCASLSVNTTLVSRPSPYPSLSLSLFAVSPYLALVSRSSPYISPLTFNRSLSPILQV